MSGIARDSITCNFLVAGHEDDRLVERLLLLEDDVGSGSYGRGCQADEQRRHDQECAGLWA